MLRPIAQKIALIFVGGSRPSLLGWYWLQRITIDWKSTKQVWTTPNTITSLETLLDKNKDLFTTGLGTLRGIEAQLYLKEDAVPKFCHARAAPYALRKSIEEDLKRLERLLKRLAIVTWLPCSPSTQVRWISPSLW